MLSLLLHVVLCICSADDNIDLISQHHQFSEVVYPSALSISYRSQDTTDIIQYLMGIHPGVTPGEFAELICTKSIGTDCVANTVKHSVMAVRNTAIGEVAVRNGFGHTAFQFQTPDYTEWNLDPARHQEALYKNLTRFAILTNHGGTFLNAFDQDVYQMGYCGNRYCCPFSVPIAFIETPRVASTATKKWITEQERRAGFGTEGWTGHFPYTRMTCCKHGHKRLKVVNARNPYSRFISVFKQFFLGEARSRIPLTRPPQQWLEFASGEGSHSGFEWRDLSEVAGVVAQRLQRRDAEADDHLQSQVGRLLDFYLHLGASDSDSDRNSDSDSDHLPGQQRGQGQGQDWEQGAAPSVEGFERWLTQLFVLRLETHAEDWAWLVEGVLCSRHSEYGQSCLRSEEWSFNHKSKSRSSGDGETQGTTESSESETLASLSTECKWLTQEATESLHQHYECDFVAFGYSRWVRAAHAAEAAEAGAASGVITPRYNAAANNSEGRVRAAAGGGGGVADAAATVECMRRRGLFAEKHLD